MEPPFCWPGARFVPRGQIFQGGEGKSPFFEREMPRTGRGREFKILTDIRELSPRVQCDATNHRAVNRH